MLDGEMNYQQLKDYRRTLINQGKFLEADRVLERMIIKADKKTEAERYL